MPTLEMPAGDHSPVDPTYDPPARADAVPVADEFRLKGGTIYLYRSGVLIRTHFFATCDVYAYAATPRLMAIVTPDGKLHRWKYDFAKREWVSFGGVKPVPIPLDPDLKIEWFEERCEDRIRLTAGETTYVLRKNWWFGWWDRAK